MSEIIKYNIHDSLIASLANKGCVDLLYMSKLTKIDPFDIIEKLKGEIYQNPKTWGEDPLSGFEPAFMYLSGNIVEKWKYAAGMNLKYRGRFQDNIVALSKIIQEKKPLRTEDIYITLGSPWVPSDVIDDFIVYLLGYSFEHVPVSHNEYTGSWYIPQKNRYMNNIRSTRIYGTERMNALYILEKTLNSSNVILYDSIKSNLSKSGEKKVISKEDTLEIAEKQQLLISKFKEWVWTDEIRKKRLMNIYENRYCNIKVCPIDGSFIKFENMNSAVSLYQYQKNAVAKILFNKNALIAHDVGSGKTYVMIAAAMELKRLNISKRNMFVVPNAIIGQWKSIFETMYKNANIIIVDPKDFSPKNRENTLRKIANSDFDAVIIPYSSFDMIPSSSKFLYEFYKNELNEVSKTSKKDPTPRLKKIAENYIKLIDYYEEEMKKEEGKITFSDLKISRLFVDEAHNYKNLPIESNIEGVLGINKSGSKKCQAMFEKVRQVQIENGGGVVFATGTPITNSITDAFVIQKYLEEDELKKYGISYFDSWIGMFAEGKYNFEIDVDTTKYRVVLRFSQFHNLGELTSMLSLISDFHSVDKTAGIPDIDGHSDNVVKRSKEFIKYLDEISERAEQVRNGYVDRKDDNMLLITVDGRKAALDMRLVNELIVPSEETKVDKCASIVYDIYKETKKQKSTQLVFCDVSIPKPEFNLYDELKRLLIEKGVVEKDIEFVHNAVTEKEREDLFKKVREGKVRILIGSTPKLGLGVNVQDRLIAEHHLDVPWRPADMTQREGRIIRQGNSNKKVYIFRYITEGSFDAYSWQLLESKQHFISKLLSGSLESRSASDIEDVVLNYAEVKALAIGNPLIKKRVEISNEFKRLITLEHRLEENRESMKLELEKLPKLIKNQEEIVSNCKEDIEYYNEYLNSTNGAKEPNLYEDIEEKKKMRKLIFVGAKNNTEKESIIASYKGFDIVAPPYNESKFFIYLKRKGLYVVELGSSDIGVLTRIDNFLNGFSEHLKTLNSALENMKDRKEVIKEELSKNTSYHDEINRVSKELEEIDRLLLVEN